MCTQHHQTSAFRACQSNWAQRSHWTTIRDNNMMELPSNSFIEKTWPGTERWKLMLHPVWLNHRNTWGRHRWHEHRKKLIRKHAKTEKLEKSNSQKRSKPNISFSKKTTQNWKIVTYKLESPFPKWQKRWSLEEIIASLRDAEITFSPSYCMFLLTSRRIQHPHSLVCVFLM